MSDAQHQRTIKNLDLVPPLETYKVTVHDLNVPVTYTDWGGEDRALHKRFYKGFNVCRSTLRWACCTWAPDSRTTRWLYSRTNTAASGDSPPTFDRSSLIRGVPKCRYIMLLCMRVRYMEFLRQLGTLVPLEGAEEPNLFLNLEKGGKDGRYTYVWSDDIMQVLFHVATAMPSSDRDPTCNEKRKYIGNDFVSIVYNDSQHNFNIHTIKVGHAPPSPPPPARG